MNTPTLVRLTPPVLDPYTDRANEQHTMFLEKVGDFIARPNVSTVRGLDATIEPYLDSVQDTVFAASDLERYSSQRKAYIIGSFLNRLERSRYETIRRDLATSRLANFVMTGKSMPARFAPMQRAESYRCSPTEAEDLNVTRVYSRFQANLTRDVLALPRYSDLVIASN